MRAAPRPTSAAGRCARCRSPSRGRCGRRWRWDDAEETVSDTAQITVRTPVGPVVVSERDGAIVSVDIGAQAEREDTTTLLATAAQQLDAFFYCNLRRFDLPLDPGGTDFQRRVYAAMQDIPFGQVRTYGELARQVGGVARAIGSACASNPIPIIIPCHRVIAGGGRLGGFSARGGVATKRALLELEGVLLPLESVPSSDGAAPDAS
ncbi:MAG: methylated-DNA--[protein]-cysteine S-methyltransferase [Rhodospirillaceae bacterium]|nr:methylated-DNA--[protein]-cysteine S-methyltransferase [Rhodospirillaceae bacterium]